MQVEDILHDQRALVVKVHGATDSFAWAIANVYGPNVVAEISSFLDLLASFKSQLHVPWVFGGDINMVRDPFEKKWGRSTTRSMTYSTTSSMLIN